jgi:hypothetical protein
MRLRGEGRRGVVVSESRRSGVKCICNYRPTHPHRIQYKNKQTLKTVLKRPMSFHRPWTRHVHLCCHKFEQKNHTTTCRVRRYAGIPVIRSKKHGNEANGLGFHQSTMTVHTCASRHIKFRSHMTTTTIHRQNHLVCLLHVSVQLHFHDL